MDQAELFGVNVRCPDVDLRSLQEPLVQSAAAGIATRVLRAASVDLVIAYDCSAALRALGFGEERGLEEDEIGSLGGCTVCDGERCFVMMPALKFLVGSPTQPADLAHVVAHEAFHALLGQRAERLAGVHERLPAGDASDRHLSVLAAQAVEEFRVERAIYEEGDAVPIPHRDKLVAELEEAEAIIGSALAPATLRGDEAIAYGRVLRTFRLLIHRFAQVAAADIATNGAIRPEDRGQIWRARIGEHYDELCAILAGVPSARRPAPRSTLDAAAIRLAPVLRRWLRAYWLEIGERDGGGLGVYSVRPLW